MNKKFKDYSNDENDFMFLDKKPKRIVFLDIDGVINTPKTYFDKDKEFLSIDKKDKDSDIKDLVLATEKELLNRLQQILNNFQDVYICFCSSNRYNRTHNQLDRVMKSYGLNNFLFLGATPIVKFEEQNIVSESFSLTDMLNEKIQTKKYYTRGYEVQHILDYYKPNYYVILDDMNDYLDSQQEHYIKIKGHLGLQDEDVIKAIEILNTFIYY